MSIEDINYYSLSGYEIKMIKLPILVIPEFSFCVKRPHPKSYSRFNHYLGTPKLRDYFMTRSIWLDLKECHQKRTKVKADFWHILKPTEKWLHTMEDFPRDRDRTRTISFPFITNFLHLKFFHTVRGIFYIIISNGLLLLASCHLRILEQLVSSLLLWSH